MRTLTEITAVKDVEAFTMQIISEGVSLNPDEDFSNYIDINTRKPTYSEDEAALRNTLLKQCFEVCEENGIDIYGFMLEIFLNQTGLDKYIPSPSGEYSE